MCLRLCLRVVVVVVLKLRHAALLAHCWFVGTAPPPAQHHHCCCYCCFCDCCCCFCCSCVFRFFVESTVGVRRLSYKHAFSQSVSQSLPSVCSQCRSFAYRFCASASVDRTVRQIYFRGLPYSCAKCLGVPKKTHTQFAQTGRNYSS